MEEVKEVEEVRGHKPKSWFNDERDEFCIINYDHDEDFGVSMNDRNKQKVSLLFQRVEKYAPWLLRKSSLNGVQLRTRHKWLLWTICYLFGVDANNALALCSVFCGFLIYLGPAFIQLLVHSLADGKVSLDLILLLVCCS
jgi:hypothetical protein